MAKTDFLALTAEQALALLREPAPTVILLHTHPDADTIGSGLALSLLLRALGSDAYCLCADEIPAHLAFLAAGQQTSLLRESLPKDFEDARVISVDVASPAQLGGLREAFEGRVSLMIDHHGAGTPFADYLVDPTAAAAGELVFDLMALAGVEMPPRAAYLLYAAISGDTGCFRFSNVTRNTHLRAAALVESGVDTAEINHLLFESKSRAQLLAEHLGFERLQFAAEGRIAIIDFPYELKREHHLLDEHLGTLVDVARGIEGVEIAVAIRQPTAENCFRLSMRASVDFDVAEVCGSFGGGGHKRAAGATLFAASMSEACEMVKKRLIISYERFLNEA